MSGQEVFTIKCDLKISIEGDAVKQWKALLEEFCADNTPYLCMRMVSATNNNYLEEYKSQVEYTEKKKYLTVSEIDFDVREKFKELCKKFNTTPSACIRGWIYQCIERGNLL